MKQVLLHVITKKTQIWAMTATCTQKMGRGICTTIGFRDKDYIFRETCDRKNLLLAVVCVGKKITQKNYREQYVARLFHRMKRIKGKGVIFCATKNTCNKVVDLVQKMAVMFGVAHFISAAAYHGGVKTRTQVLEQWNAGLVNVMIATSAFGLGVDTKDIRQVVFDGMCFSVSAWAQMSGRAGRDGRQAFVETNIRGPMLSTILYVLANGCFDKVHNKTERTTTISIKNKNYFRVHFLEACLHLYSMIRPFHCLRSAQLTTFSFDYKERIETQMMWCGVLGGEKCSSCVARASDCAVFGAKKYTMQSYTQAVAKRKAAFVDEVISNGGELIWKEGHVAKNGGDIFLTLLSLLELFLVDQKVILTPVLNVRMQHVKHLTVHLL